jgi:hypothetical protein
VYSNADSIADGDTDSDADADNDDTIFSSKFFVKPWL